MVDTWMRRYDLVRDERNKLKKENKRLTNIVDQFITKSNAVSMIVRSGAWNVSTGHSSLTKLYHFQCEVEEELERREDGIQ